MKFVRQKISALSGDTEVHFTLQSDSKNPDPYYSENDPFTLVAGPNGIRLKGKSVLINEYSDLNAMAKVMADCWNEYNKLRPKIYSPFEH